MVIIDSFLFQNYSVGTQFLLGHSKMRNFILTNMEAGKRRRKRRAAILRRDILYLEYDIYRLERQLRELHASRISTSYSYQQTVAYVETLIQQKKKEIKELSEVGLKEIE
jgi:hypothetical protein